MKWKPFFFNINDCLQQGIDEFARLSGYKIEEKRQAAKNETSKRKQTGYALLLRFLIAILLVVLLLVVK